MIIITTNKLPINDSFPILVLDDEFAVPLILVDLVTHSTLQLSVKQVHIVTDRFPSWPFKIFSKLKRGEKY